MSGRGAGGTEELASLPWERPVPPHTGAWSPPLPGVCHDFAMGRPGPAAPVANCSFTCHEGQEVKPRALFEDGADSEPEDECSVKFSPLFLSLMLFYKFRFSWRSYFSQQTETEAINSDLQYKSFPIAGQIFFQSSRRLQFSSTDTVIFISRGSDIPQ